MARRTVSLAASTKRTASGGKELLRGLVGVPYVSTSISGGSPTENPYLGVCCVRKVGLSPPPPEISCADEMNLWEFSGVHVILTTGPLG